MSDHRFKLEKYRGPSSRYVCPGCGKKEFARYLDTFTGKHVHSSVGRCNREDSCGYHLTPKKYLTDNHITLNTPLGRPEPEPVKMASFIPPEILRQSLESHEPNNFIKFLLNLFGPEITSQLVNRYFIGTTNYYPGGTIFWQVDTRGRVHAGKIMLYNPITGRRSKDLRFKVSWVHAALRIPDFKLNQTFFGEHLLTDKSRSIAIVESEKTAIIASIYFPQLIWLAAGSKAGIDSIKCIPLAGRQVILYPDLGAFEIWSKKAKELSYLAFFTVSSLLEKTATETERNKGFDIADYLTMFDHSEPVKSESLDEHPANEYHNGANQLQNNSIESSENTIDECRNQQSQVEFEVIELERYFSATPLPTNPIQLQPGVTVIDIRKCIESNLLYVKAHKGNRTYLPYLEQLRQLKHILLNKMN